MMKEIVDGNNAICGRMASYVAKQLLKGKEVVVINSEKVIFTGNKDLISSEIRRLREAGRGGSMKGPNISKMPDRLLKRKIRGMLPWDKPRGKEVFKNLRCFVGTGNLKEEELKNITTLKHKLPTKYASLEKIIARI